MAVSRCYCCWYSCEPVAVGHGNTGFVLCVGTCQEQKRREKHIPERNNRIRAVLAASFLSPVDKTPPYAGSRSHARVSESDSPVAPVKLDSTQPMLTLKPNTVCTVRVHRRGTGCRRIVSLSARCSSSARTGSSWPSASTSTPSLGGA